MKALRSEQAYEEGKAGVVNGAWLGIPVRKEQFFKGGLKDPGEPEGQGQRRVKPSAFNGDDGLAGDPQLVRKPLL